MPSALVVEPSAPVAAALRSFLGGAGFDVSGAPSVDEALRQLRTGPPPALLVGSCVGGFEGERLCAGARALVPGLPVLLLYAPDVDDAADRAWAAGGAAALVGPLKRANVVSVARLLAGGGAALPPAPAVPAPAEEEGTGRGGAQADFAFLKRLMPLEVKRSRRYRYPTALLLAGAQAPLLPAQAAEVLAALSAGVRDIDLVVPFTEGRFLVFLPHTGLEGARTVAERLRERVQGPSPAPGVGFSVGVAGYEPTPESVQVSFGSLLKDASDALKRALAAGGGRVELSGSPRKARRDRISLT